MIHIEMGLHKDEKDTWDLRVGGIGNCCHSYGLTKEAVLEVISKEMDTHIEAVIDES